MYTPYRVVRWTTYNNSISVLQASNTTSMTIERTYKLTGRSTPNLQYKTFKEFYQNACITKNKHCHKRNNSIRYFIVSSNETLYNHFWSFLRQWLKSLAKLFWALIQGFGRQARPMCQWPQSLNINAPFLKSMGHWLMGQSFFY